MTILYKKSGVIAVTLMFVISILATRGLDATYQSLGVSGDARRSLMYVAVVPLPIFSLLFLDKLYRLASRIEASAIDWFHFGIGSSMFAFFFWTIVIAACRPFGMDPSFFDQLRGDGSYSVQSVYIAEQLLSGALFDVLEAFKWRLTSVEYGSENILAAIITLGMRLTGSLVIGSILLGAVFRRSA